MLRILLVEDNEWNRDMLARRLTRHGFAVETADDGVAGVARAQFGEFDLILMDMSLPVLDGWQATRVLKSDDRTRAVPIIALTAHALPGDRERALDAGCDDYDSKPIDFPGLIAKIVALCPPDRPPSLGEGHVPAAPPLHSPPEGNSR